MLRKVLSYAGVTIAVLVVIVLAVGVSLPQSHVASGEATLPVPPAAVFAAVTEVDRYPDWRTDVDRIEVLSTAPLRWREHSGGDAIMFEAVESHAPDRFVVRIADPDLPFGGTWTYDLSPDPGGTRLLIVERGEVYNPVFRFASRFVFGHTATIDRVLTALRRRFP